MLRAWAFARVAAVCAVAIVATACGGASSPARVGSTSLGATIAAPATPSVVSTAVSTALSTVSACHMFSLSAARSLDAQLEPLGGDDEADETNCRYMHGSGTSKSVELVADVEIEQLTGGDAAAIASAYARESVEGERFVSSTPLPGLGSQAFAIVWSRDGGGEEQRVIWQHHALVASLDFDVIFAADPSPVPDVVSQLQTAAQHVDAQLTASGL